MKELRKKSFENILNNYVEYCLLPEEHYLCFYKNSTNQTYTSSKLVCFRKHHAYQVYDN